LNKTIENIQEITNYIGKIGINKSKQRFPKTLKNYFYFYERLIKMKSENKKKIGAFIPARNEEKYLAKTLESLVAQDLKPDKIILVNDGSSDQTKSIAIEYGCEVIDLDNDKVEGQGGPKMTKLHQLALSSFEDDFDYILQLDADHIIPNNYISYLVSEMEKNPKIVIGGCLIDGVKSKEPMGTGRLVRFDFHKQIGINRKVKYGLDTYPLLKARQLGYEYKIFEIDSKMPRKQAETYFRENYILIGNTCKSLGYHYVAAVMLFLQRTIEKKNIKIFFWQLRGFFGRDVELYDEEFRKFVRSMQKDAIYKKIKRIFLYKSKK
jgi:glycosyltransferase involved in cell wall biosynthesis